MVLEKKRSKNKKGRRFGSDEFDKKKYCIRFNGTYYRGGRKNISPALIEPIIEGGTLNMKILNRNFVS